MSWKKGGWTTILWGCRVASLAPVAFVGMEATGFGRIVRDEHDRWATMRLRSFLDDMKLWRLWTPNFIRIF